MVERDWLKRSYSGCERSGVSGVCLANVSSSIFAFTYTHMFSCIRYYRSLNIDLDSLMKDYSGTMRTIIAHLDLDLSPEEKTKLAKELDFYDIDSSPLYRFSMTNPLVNHIDTKR